MFVIMFKQHGALNCEQQVFGPFDSYADAEEALSGSDMPRLYGQGGCEWPSDEFTRDTNGHRYIQELTWINGCVL